MKSACLALFVFGALVAAEPQFFVNSPWQYPNFFRSSQQLQPVYQPQLAPIEGRFFFGTQTFTLTTQTSTSTSTVVTTCTTSTAALTSCVAATGRRRRQTNGLYYNENDEEVFLVPAAKVERSVDEVPAAPEKATPAIQVPFVVQPGYEHMTDNRQARLFIAFATGTTTVTTTTTSTSSLVAVCSSVSAYQLCGSNGK